MASSRRVKKGPGRRPQSAKRQRFMDLRARGWSVRAAAREVGVSRSPGTDWSRGHKACRNGVVVGFVAPLDRLAVRQISSFYLYQDECIEICTRTSASRSPICVSPGRACGRSLVGSNARRRRSHGSCRAMRSPAAGIARSTLIAAPPWGGHAGTDAESTSLSGLGNRRRDTASLLMQACDPRL